MIGFVIPLTAITLFIGVFVPPVMEQKSQILHESR